MECTDGGGPADYDVTAEGAATNAKSRTFTAHEGGRWSAETKKGNVVAVRCGNASVLLDGDRGGEERGRVGGITERSLSSEALFVKKSL